MFRFLNFPKRNCTDFKNKCSTISTELNRTESNRNQTKREKRKDFITKESETLRIKEENFENGHARRKQNH